MRPHHYLAPTGDSLMNMRRCARVAALLVFYCLASIASGQSTPSPDGLVPVKPRQMELAWLRPGADFRPYTKIIVDRTQVAFQPGWLKDYNLDAPLNQVSPDDAAKILAAAQTNVDDIFKDAFTKAGYQVVTTTGPDVLRVNSGILDLMLNAPKGQGTGFATVWVITAGQAALIVEVRDTVTNALLGRVADREATQELGRQLASNATNLYDFRLLFQHWAGVCVRALAEVKAASPIPKDLQPNQRL
jgi:Protein of unknown function (DUF3313)